MKVNIQGDWIRGFTQNIRQCTVKETELWDVLHGLELVDSLKVVNWIKSRASTETTIAESTRAYTSKGNF